MAASVEFEFVEREGWTTFSVRVVPRAARTSAAGLHNGALKMRLAAPPVDGAANAELIRALAKALGVAQNEVSILRGHRARLKVVRVPDRCAEKLMQLVSDARPI